MKTVIVTVGASLFLNYQKNLLEVSEAWNKECRSIASEIDMLKDLPAAEYEAQSRRIGQIQEWLRKNWLHGVDKLADNHWRLNDNQLNTTASAEISSILKIAELEKDHLNLRLLASDTVLSRLAAEIIAEIFQSYSTTGEWTIGAVFNPHTDVITGLQVKNSRKYEREGVVNLIYKVTRIIKENFDVVLNMTGGYKATIPYFTLLGQIYKAPVYYLFENTEEILKIPWAPIALERDLFDRYLEDFTRLDVEKTSPVSELKYQFIQEAASCLEVDEGYVTLNPLGELLWDRYKEGFFIFFAPHDTYAEIQQQADIMRIIRTKFHQESNREAKTENKNGHLIYDDGDNNNRICYFDDQGQVFIYKTFQNEEKQKKYINTCGVNAGFRDKVKRESKSRKVEIDNV